MGADFIIAVNVLPDFRSPRKRTKDSVEPNLIGILMQSIYITSYSLINSSLAQADVVIQPELDNIPLGDFRRMNECIIKGEKAARKALPDIKQRLKGEKVARKSSPDPKKRGVGTSSY